LAALKEKERLTTSWGGATVQADWNGSLKDAEGLCFSGRVVTGRGEGAAFTRLDWVRTRFREELGIEPYPGTVNLIVDDQASCDRWRALLSRPSIPIDPPTAQWCRAYGYAVRIAGWLPAAVVLPDVPAYPGTQVELIAALPVRQVLSLTDGDRLLVTASDPLAVRAVMLDVDGTLVDSLRAYRVVAERAAAAYDLRISDEYVREALCTTRPFWDLAVPLDYPARAATMEALRHEASRLWPEVLREHGHVFPDAARVLRVLRRHHVKLGIVTGARRGSLELLRQHGVLNLFDAIITGEDVRSGKPDPEGLLKCAAALAVDPREAVYVGDSPLDIQASRAAGMFAIGVLGGAGDSMRLSACGPDRVIASRRQLLDVLRLASDN
jgi:HAD superfamily hydrolase (TIGR01509 family)